MKIKVEVLKKDEFYPNGYSVDIEGTDVPKKGVPVTENFNHYEVIGVADLDHFAKTGIVPKWNPPVVP